MGNLCLFRSASTRSNTKERHRNVQPMRDFDTHSPLPPPSQTNPNNFPNNPVIPNTTSNDHLDNYINNISHESVVTTDNKHDFILSTQSGKKLFEMNDIKQFEKPLNPLKHKSKLSNKSKSTECKSKSNQEIEKLFDSPTNRTVKRRQSSFQFGYIDGVCMEPSLSTMQINPIPIRFRRNSSEITSLQSQVQKNLIRHIMAQKSLADRYPVINKIKLEQLQKKQSPFEIDDYIENNNVVPKSKIPPTTDQIKIKSGISLSPPEKATRRKSSLRLVKSSNSNNNNNNDDDNNSEDDVPGTTTTVPIVMGHRKSRIHGGKYRSGCGKPIKSHKSNRILASKSRRKSAISNNYNNKSGMSANRKSTISIMMKRSDL